MSDLRPQWGSALRSDLSTVLRRATAMNPRKVLFDASSELKVSYETTNTTTDRVASFLRSTGVRPGDRCAGMLDNDPDVFACWMGANRAGAMWVPINTRFDASFLSRMLRDAEPGVVFVDTEYAPTLFQVNLAECGVHTVVVRGAIPGTAAAVAVRSWDDVLAASGGAGETPVRPEDTSLLLYTSGTTGFSKGCLLSHNAVCTMSRAYIDVYGRMPEDIIYSPLPMCHMASMSQVVQTVLLGSTVALPKRFSISRFWDEIERTGASMAGLMGSPLMMLASAPDSPAAQRCFGQLKFVQGSPFPKPLQDTWRRRFGMHRCGPGMFGMSEASPIVSVKADVEAPPGSSGMRNDLYDVALVDERDREVPPGTVGEILCRPRQPDIMFSGYWRNPEATLAATRGLWFRTGDLGKFDERGFFYFVDRQKDFIRRRGENISSLEIELAVLAHSDIAECAAHAVASEFLDDDVKVVVILKDGTALSEAELSAWLEGRLPDFCLPRYIEFRPALPRNPVGRVKKAELRQEGITAATWEKLRDARKGAA